MKLGWPERLGSFTANLLVLEICAAIQYHFQHDTLIFTIDFVVAVSMQFTNPYFDKLIARLRRRGSGA